MVSSEGFESELDRKGPWRRETPIVKFKDEVREMRLTMSTLMEQNQLLIEFIKSGHSLLLDATRRTYIKNVPKPTT